MSKQNSIIVISYFILKSLLCIWLCFSSNKFSRPEPMSHFTCGIAAIIKWGKTKGIVLVVFPKQYVELVKVPRSCCVENCSNNVKSQPNLNFYILLSDKNRHWCWLQAIRQTQHTASKILYYSAQVDQLYAKEVKFCSFVRKSNQACINYSPRCIQQFLSDRHTWRVSQNYL